MFLDTNALFLPVRVGFPLEREVDRLAPGAELVVLSSTVRELDRLVARATPGAPAARALAERYRRIEGAGRGDTAVVRAAGRWSAGVVTADRALRQRLMAAGADVLYPRDRHRLERFVAPRSPAASSEARRPRKGFEVRPARQRTDEVRTPHARR